MLTTLHMPDLAFRHRRASERGDGRVRLPTDALAGLRKTGRGGQYGEPTIEVATIELAVTLAKAGARVRVRVSSA